MYEVQVHDDGETEVRRIPDGCHPDNLTFPDEESLADELRSYGKEEHEITDALEALMTSEDYNWITV